MNANKNTKIILASKSARRRELLSRLNLEFEIIKPEVKEQPPTPGISAETYVLSQATMKALSVAETLPRTKFPTIVIGCDTVAEYEEMLQSTHGRL